LSVLKSRLFSGLLVIAVASATGPQALAESAGALPWPAERPGAVPPQTVEYVVPKSNYVLDFHGSVQKPDLVIFMAGNQYRVFPELVAAFRTWAKQEPRFADLPTENIFYATTPPGRLIDAMSSGKIALGNFWIDVTPSTLWPDVFMTGARQQQRLRQMGQVNEYFPYATNRGVVLLVKAGNPKRIGSVTDLTRADIRVAISSPKGEPASYENYAAVLDGQGGKGFAEQVLAKPNTLTPNVVHHRENPQFIADDRADVAPMFWHFGDYLKRSFPDQLDYVSLPREGNNFAMLAISTIRTAPRPRAAQAWMEFMRSDVAADIYMRNGFDFAAPADRAKGVQLP